ncbi:MAG: hypothetical protein B5M51_09180 [Anaerolinea sp. 4484_236]|nr:MAG: hypothetical protein B5M51_09180 [Anaerolinea sp. 4484_236]
MSQPNLPLPRSHVKRESGQSMILIAFIFIALLGFVGLTVDVGRLFMFRGMLRNATDAASLSAAAQYREGRSHSEIEASAKDRNIRHAHDLFTISGSSNIHHCRRFYWRNSFNGCGLGH